MKRTLATAAMLSAMALGPASLANNNSSTSTSHSSNGGALTLQGSVPQVSSIPAPDAPTSSNNITLSGTALTVTSLADSASHAKDWSIIVPFKGVGANYQAKIGLTSQNGALKNSTTTTDANSTNIVKYSSTASWGSTVSVTLGADGTAPSKHVQSSGSAQQTADLTLTIQCLSSDNPNQLVSGNYEDTLTVAIGTDP